MTTLSTISSLVNSSTTVGETKLPDHSQPFIYITAILRAGTVTDVVTPGGTFSLGGGGSIGPVDFPSPIQCTSFTAQFLGQVSYYVLGPATSRGSPGGGGAFTNTASVLFDGTDDSMTLASEINFTGTFSFSIWVKPVAGDEGMISVGNGGASGPFVDWYGPVYKNRWVISNMGNFQSPEQSAQAGSWYHLLLIRDSSNVIKLYADGAQTGPSRTFTGTAKFSRFGASTGSGDLALNAYLDEIAFWDSDQTSNKDAMSDDSGAAPADLKGLSPDYWYRMGDVNGSSSDTIVNQGGAGSNDATLINGPTYTTEVPS